MGSGNGYWTYMLRRLEQGKKKLQVSPVDNGLSEWRTMWVADTVEMDGMKWLNQHQGAKDATLLLVYPNTGEDFTSKMIKAYSMSYPILTSVDTHRTTNQLLQKVRRSLQLALRTTQALQRLQRRRLLSGWLERCPIGRKSSRYHYLALLVETRRSLRLRSYQQTEAAGLEKSDFVGLTNIDVHVAGERLLACFYNGSEPGV